MSNKPIIPNKVIIKLKDRPKSEEDVISKETIQNSIQDLNNIFSHLRKCQNKIKQCNNAEELNKIKDLGSISNDLGLISQTSVVIDEMEFKKRIEEANQLYRNTEILYFNKKFELLNQKMEKTFKKSEDNIKDISGGTLFSIASVFLGISLTSALVTGVQFISQDFLVLYFMTCLLIAIITIGLSSIFMRKVDKKTYIIVSIIVLTSILWFITAIFSFQTHYNNIDNEEHIQDSKNYTH